MVARVVYRLEHAAEAEGRYLRQASGPGMYGVVTLSLAPPEDPLPRIVVTSALPPDDPIAAYLDAIALGIQRAAYAAGLFGVKATILRGRFHEVDSRPDAYHHAASRACQAIFSRAGLLRRDIVDDALFPSVRTPTGVGEGAHDGLVLHVEPDPVASDRPPVWATSRWPTLAPEAQALAEGAVEGLSEADPPWVDLRLILHEGFDRGSPSPVDAFGSVLADALAAAAPLTRRRLGPELVWDEAGPAR